MRVFDERGDMLRWSRTPPPPKLMTISEVLALPVRRRWRCWFGFHAWAAYYWVPECERYVRRCCRCGQADSIAAAEAVSLTVDDR